MLCEELRWTWCALVVQKMALSPSNPVRQTAHYLIQVYHHSFKKWRWPSGSTLDYHSEGKSSNPDETFFLMFYPMVMEIKQLLDSVIIFILQKNISRSMYIWKDGDSWWTLHALNCELDQQRCTKWEQLGALWQSEFMVFFDH